MNADCTGPAVFGRGLQATKLLAARLRVVGSETVGRVSQAVLCRPGQARCSGCRPVAALRARPSPHRAPAPAPSRAARRWAWGCAPVPQQSRGGPRRRGRTHGRYGGAGGATGPPPPVAGSDPPSCFAGVGRIGSQSRRLRRRRGGRGPSPFEPPTLFSVPQAENGR